MIGKIGVHNLNQVKANKPETTEKPVFKGNDEFPQISELRGSEMLANYSVAFINKMPKEKLELNELPLINAETSVDNIDGEKIYSSDGKLDSIVVEEENITTIYYPSEGDVGFIAQVKVIDKETGKKVLAQENDKNGRELTQYVYKFYNEGDKEIIESSSYEQGKYVRSWKDSFDGDRCESLSKYENDYTMSFSDKQNYKSMSFDKNGQLVEVYTSKQMPNCEIKQRFGFIEGELYEATKEKEIYLKKFDIEAVLSDDKFNPADKFPFTKLPADDLTAEDLDGERTYYSNGVVESVMTNFGGVDTKVVFSPQGIVKSIETDTKILTYDDHRNQIITEQLGENETKTTYIRERKVVNVTYELDGYKKTVGYDSDGIVDFYSEEAPDGTFTYFDVNHEGFITWSYNKKA